MIYIYSRGDIIDSLQYAKKYLKDVAQICIQIKDSSGLFTSLSKEVPDLSIFLCVIAILIGYIGSVQL